MAYTNPELVRKHLHETTRSSSGIELHRMKLTGTLPLSLPHAGLVEDSERVMTKEQLAPEMEVTTLHDDDVSLTRANLVPESVVVAKDSSMGAIYKENTDYVVDCANGRLRRVTGGAIASGQMVVIWYDFFTLFARGEDYAISYQNGEITRLDEGVIADGQEIFISYQIESGVFSDEIIANAILEASVLLDGRLEQPVVDDAVRAVTVAETYLAVSILMQIKATEALRSSVYSTASRSATSSSLLDLSTKYRRDCEEIIAPYAKKSARMASPVRTAR